VSLNKTTILQAVRAILNSIGRNKLDPTEALDTWARMASTLKYEPSKLRDALIIHRLAKRALENMGKIPKTQPQTKQGEQ
jgi:hypothetical protein